MFKTIFLTALTLLIAIGGGAGSVWWALERDFGFGTVEVGPWTAYPARGTPDADPYTKARFSREADLALGQAEGLAFLSTSDSAGRPLRFECTYLLEGTLPPARFWTLHARDAENRVARYDERRAPALHSLALLRREDSTAAVTISHAPAPGNWLATPRQGAFTLVLTLYDTSTTGAARIDQVELPRIAREGCDE